MPQKKNFSPTLALFVGIVLGIFVAFLLYPKAITSKNMATVNQEQDSLLVFIHAKPLREYTTLGTIDLDAIQGIVNAEKEQANSEDKVHTTLNEIITDLDFNSKLKKMLSKVKGKFPKADAVIFSNQMSTCEAIKFR